MLLQFREQIEQEIAEISHKSLSALRSLWEETFEASMCEDNIRIMVNHVRAFYEEIIEETKTKKAVIISDIQSEFFYQCKTRLQTKY